MTFALSMAAPGAGPAAAGLSAPVKIYHPAADPRPAWAVRAAKLTAASVIHTRVMARAARELARARREAALAAQQQAAAQAPPASAQPAVAAPAAPSGGSLSGTLDCAGLEQLWQEGGGAASMAVLMASIAMAESGGHQYDTGSMGEEGYWQIAPGNGDATYDPLGNAQAAVHVLATQGLGAWTTYTDGAYAGRC